MTVDNFSLNDVQDSVVILGANLQAVDIASYLITQGKQVTMINPKAKETIDIEQSPWVRKFTLAHLYAQGVPKSTIRQIVRRSRKTVFLIMMNDCGFEKEITCQTGDRMLI